MAHGPEIRVINDPEVLRLIADPRRLRLLELLRQQPRTVKELAALLNLPRTGLYYHVNLLEAHDLVTVADERVVSGIIERRYRATAYRLSVDKTMLGAGDGDSSPLDVFLSVVLDEAATEIRRAVAAGLIDLDQTHEDAFKPRRLLIGRQWFRFTDDELAAFSRRYEALMEDFRANSVFVRKSDPDADTHVDPATGELYEFLTSFYPIVPPGAEPDAS
jgi:DNA-binding transcriptional ArsR family regulator